MPTILGVPRRSDLSLLTDIGLATGLGRESLRRLSSNSIALYGQSAAWTLIRYVSVITSYVLAILRGPNALVAIRKYKYNCVRVLRPQRTTQTLKAWLSTSPSQASYCSEAWYSPTSRLHVLGKDIQEYGQSIFR